MKITLLIIGKTEEKYLQEGISKYTERLKHYITFNIKEIPALKNTKNLNPDQIKKNEADLILKYFPDFDYKILLDEKGKSLTSLEFADFLNKKTLQSIKNIVFVIGGAYGFDNDVYEKADMKLSLSNMTFSHQMIRLFFAEQLYRAFSILRNEPYHNE
ncbi:MAG: 23S rRNA (pseudouridine(1915)-N(3))-methyltransferase RlmH [Bacteroidetes bacterium]|nr:23S rRNA (pseudouridine(1915)-N(3))-methyltransferase RlmH [Bacteroidota bacterium]